MKQLFKRAAICFLILCAPLVACKADDSVEEPAQVKQAEKCPDIMKYKVGDYVFGFPRKAIYWRAYSDKNKQLFKRSCNDVPELIAFKYSPTQFGKYQDPKNKSSLLSLSVWYHAEGIDSDTYKHMKVEEKLKKAGKALDDIPITNGFYKFEFSGKQYLFIATNTKTKLGNPLTFYCSPNSYDRSSLVCRTSFPWREGMSIGVASSTKMFAVEDWPKLYEEIQKFAENLIIEQEPEGK